MDKNDFRICVLGLGYVGLPLAVALARHFKISGFDINQKKVDSLRNGKDPMDELSDEQLGSVHINYSSDPAVLKQSNFIIAAVPTPITKAKVPDLTPVIRASETIGKNLSKGTIISFESTVYPGVTEDICVPILERFSGLKCGRDFKVAYSPERINPGDREHTIDRVTKVVSGMDTDTLEKTAFVYGQVTQVHRAESIKVAEAAKVIENIQRDLNIALMNELSLIFDKMHIDLQNVLSAAGTKWNFHKYRPGLVGGHCIGVDPYYLTYKAQELGYEPQVILAGRAINDSMAGHVADMTVKALIQEGKLIKGSKVLILGLTFKENVRDARNSKTKDVIESLKEYGVDVVACDPFLSQEEVDEEEFGVRNIKLANAGKYDAVILAVPHTDFVKLELADYTKFFNDKKVFIDVKGYYSKEEAKRLGFKYLRL